MTSFELTTVALLIISTILGMIGWLLNRLLVHQRQLSLDKETHRKELLIEKNRTTETRFDQLIQRMDNLVEQISRLVKDQDVVTKSVSTLEGRVGKVEKRIGEHFVRCNEREKLITDLKTRQSNAIIRYDKALLNVGDHCS